MSDYITYQVPVIPLATYSEPCSWVGNEHPISSWILPRVLELTYTAWDLEPFAKDCNWSGPPFRWDTERRFLLRCELDAAFFLLYIPADANGAWQRPRGETVEELGILETLFETPRDAIAYIMDTFPIIRREDESNWGDYRTKRVILEIYDALANSIATGRPYQTQLNPPPADAQCCHPPRVLARIGLEA